MSSLSDAYRKISSINESLDYDHMVLNEKETRLVALNQEINNLTTEIENLKASIELNIDKATQIADEVNIPYDYAPPLREEWDSSDWNSSSQYC